MITQAYVDRLGTAARTVEARLVHAILTQPDLPPLIELDIMFWWDALAATSLVLGPRDDLVCYRLRTVAVVLDGPSSGRTIDDPDGTPQLPDTPPTAHDSKTHSRQSSTAAGSPAMHETSLRTSGQGGGRCGGRGCGDRLR